MTKKNYTSWLALAALTATLIALTTAHAQTSGRETRVVVKQTGTQTTSVTTTNSALSALPMSDAVATIDIKRILNEAVPRLLSSNASQLAKFNADLETFRARTGIDPRSFDQLAVGVRFINPSPNSTKARTVAIARGTFNSASLMSAVRTAPNSGAREESYNNQKIYIFKPTSPVNMPAARAAARINEIALTMLGADSLAFGDLESVRAAIDANKGSARVSPEMISLATRTPGALVGFGMNVPPSFADTITRQNPDIGRTVSYVKQFYGSIGMTATGYNMLAFAHTGNAGQAQSLSDTLLGLLQLGKSFAPSLNGDMGKLAQNALNNLSVTTAGDTVQIKFDLAQSDIPMILNLVNRPRQQTP